VHIVADILIYYIIITLCVKRGVNCAEKPQKGCHFRKKIEGLPLQKKKRFHKKKKKSQRRGKKERFATKTTRAREQRLSAE